MSDQPKPVKAEVRPCRIVHDVPMEVPLTVFVLTRLDDEVNCHYDEAYTFAVAAADEAEARRLASEQAGDEGAAVWLDSARSSCVPADLKSPAVLCRDFVAG